MVAYQTPGVYFEWLDDARPSIQPVRTDIAGFVGIAERGPLFQAVKVESWTQFVTAFGGFTQQGYLAHAVGGFFANGGRICWIVRVADRETETAGVASLELLDDTRQPVLMLRAADPGVWARRLRVSVIRLAADRFSLIVQLPDGRRESWKNLSMQRWLDASHRTEDPACVEKVLNDPRTGSRVLRAEIRGASPPGACTSGLTGGRDGLAPTLVIQDKSERPALRLIAAGPTSRDAPIRVQLEPAADGTFKLTVTPPVGAASIWPSLSMQPWLDAGHHTENPAYVETALNHPRAGARVLVAQDISSTSDAGAAPLMNADGYLTGGLGFDHFSQGLDVLAAQDGIGVLAMPDIMPGNYDRVVPAAPASVQCDVDTETKAVKWPYTVPELPPALTEDEIARLQIRMLVQCGELKNRVAILDMPRQGGADRSPEGARVWRKRFDDFPDVSRYAALYYPWLRVSDPLKLHGRLLDVPPSGHVAGVYARVDWTAGVHKPPANEELQNVQDVSYPLDDEAHGTLNIDSVNVIRAYPGRGLRIAGARTLDREPEWRYVNVRRLLIMIEQAIERQTQWIVFEPNNRDLWGKVDRVVSNFLAGLWERGMLDGATAADAYSVTCDETTNPPEEVGLGRCICRIGVQPPWPAEFVVIRIGKTEAGMQIIEGSGAA